jgi:hypothetical protein
MLGSIFSRMIPAMSNAELRDTPVVMAVPNNRGSWQVVQVVRPPAIVESAEETRYREMLNRRWSHVLDAIPPSVACVDANVLGVMENFNPQQVSGAVPGVANPVIANTLASAVPVVGSAVPTVIVPQTTAVPVVTAVPSPAVAATSAPGAPSGNPGVVTAAVAGAPVPLTTVPPVGASLPAMPRPGFAGILAYLRGDAVEICRASQMRALFASVDTMGEDDVAHQARIGVFTWLRARVFSGHKTYHRATNKMFKRVKVLKELREQMIFHGAAGIRVKTPLAVNASAELARRVIRDALEDKVIEKSECGWYRKMLTELYFIEDEDEVFARLVASAPNPHVVD